MIHLVVALRAEAGPLAEAFELAPEPPGDGPFALFTGDRARLVVSGVGRVAAGAATAYLEGRFPGEAAIWANAGVAAHRDLPLGTPVVGHKVVEEATSRSWYPTLLVEPPSASATVRTVDRPMAEPPDDALYEMEAAGFVSTVLRWATSERLAVVKVVSDHGVSRPRRLDRAEVRSLLEASAEGVMEYMNEMETLVLERSGCDRADYLDNARRRFRFSVTEGHRLGRLGNRAAVLGVAADEIERIEARSAGEFMRRLEERLDAVAMEDA